jgi:hypothetical protein
MHLSEEDIARYAEALLFNKVHELPAHIRSHVKECDQCADEVMAVYELLRDEAESTHHHKSRSISFAKWVPVAAGITLLIGISGYFLFLHDKEPDGNVAHQDTNVSKTDSVMQLRVSDTLKDNTLVLGKDTAQLNKKMPHQAKPEKQQQKNQYARAYVPSRSLESLVSRFEKVTYRGNNIEVNRPVSVSFKKGEPVRLSWSNPDAVELTVEVLNNIEETVHESTTTGDSVVIAKPFDKGLYYWKLFNQDFDLLFCGKIVVE